MYKAYRDHILKHGYASESKEHKYKLWYFNLRGRAETIRLIFAQAGVDYEDFRFTHQEWPEHKSAMPWGTVPVLEVDELMIGQSTTICRYLAAEFGLAGNDDLERAVLDSIGETITDIREKYAPAFSEKDEEKKAELKRVYVEQTLPVLLRGLDKALSDSQFFSGDKVTWPDLHFFACLESLPSVDIRHEDIFAECPNLFALFTRVKELPNVASWLESRPETMF